MSHPKHVLCTVSRPPPEDGAIDYSAYFKELLAPQGTVATGVIAWARGLGVGVHLIESGVPFAGMRCHLEISPLTQSEVAAFRAAFSPDQDSAIPFL